MFPSSSVVAIVFDPPHVSDAGHGIVGAAEWADRYGTRSPGLRGDNIAHLFPPFLVAARAVLQPETGSMLAKIADQVHTGTKQLQHVDFVMAARVGSARLLASTKP